MTVTSNAGAEAARMRRNAEQMHTDLVTLNRDYGLRLQTGVRANMSGRSGVFYSPPEGGPGGEVGPRAQTGDLRRSVALHHIVTADLIGSSVGSNEPQARRLELGFIGTDSLGRHYDQPPYPSWRPGLAALEEPYRKDVAATTVKALRA